MSLAPVEHAKVLGPAEPCERCGGAVDRATYRGFDVELHRSDACPGLPVEPLGAGPPCGECGEETERGFYRGREIVSHSRGFCPGSSEREEAS